MTQLLASPERDRPTARLPRPARSLGAQGLRFTLVGSAGTLAQLALYAGTSSVLGAQLASVAAWLVSTLLTNAVHRAVTFGVHGAGRSRSDLLAAFVTCLVGLLLTSVVLSDLPDGDGSAGLLAIVAVNAVVGAARFVGMRWWLSEAGQHATARFTGAVRATLHAAARTVAPTRAHH